jgi:predicted nucleic acid-binding protein
MLTKPPLIIDNCVLGNYYSARKLSLLKELYPDKIVIPNHVLEESSLKTGLMRRIKELGDDSWFTIYSMNTLEEINMYARLERRIKGKGEAAVLTIAYNNDATVCSDNISDILPYVNRHNLKLMTSLSILFDAYSREVITKENGNIIIDDILQDGNKLPVTSFQPVINWFEEGEGRKIY